MKGRTLTKHGMLLFKSPCASAPPLCPLQLQAAAQQLAGELLQELPRELPHGQASKHRVCLATCLVLASCQAWVPALIAVLGARAVFGVDYV